MEQAVWWKALSDAERAPWVNKAEAAKAKYQKVLAKYHNSRDYQKYAAAKEAYKADQLALRNKLMGVSNKKKRARSESAPKKAKKAKRSSRRSRTPKSGKRSARTPKAPKSAVTSDSEASTKKSRRRCARRRARAPKASKSKSASRRRARTPKSR